MTDQPRAQGQPFDANPPREAATGLQGSFNVAAGEPRSDEPQADEEASVGAGESESSQDWLGGREKTGPVL